MRFIPSINSRLGAYALMGASLLATVHAREIYDDIFFPDYMQHTRTQVEEIWGLRKKKAVKDIKRGDPERFRQQEEALYSALQSDRVLLIVSSASCPPCRELEKSLEQRMENLRGISLTVFNIDDAKDQYIDKILFDEGIMPSITYTPFCIAACRGRVVGRYIGYDAKTDRVAELLDQNGHYRENATTVQAIIENLER